MASLTVTPPEQFNCLCPDDWPKWISQFDRFQEASKLSTKSEECQVNTLIYSMGDKADDVLAFFGLGDADKKKYSTVKEKFDQYF